MELLEKIKKYLKSIGIPESAYHIVLSMWYDAEIKEWSYYMIKVTVVDNNYNRFYILKNLTDYVTRILPENLLRETVVIVE
jgi:predicted carbohydrate-binding protein with CBM5 and CBM33 domain